MADLGLSDIASDPNYVNANAATKKAIFDKYSAQDQNYTGANPATQAAIRKKFGIADADPADIDAEPGYTTDRGQTEQGKVPGSNAKFGGSEAMERSVTGSNIPETGPTLEEATKKLQDLDAKGTPKTDPAYQQAIKDRYYALRRKSTMTPGEIGMGAAGGAIGGAALRGASKVLGPAARLVGRAVSKAPEAAEKEATSAAEALRAKTTQETEKGAAAKEKEIAATREATQQQAQAVEAKAGQEANTVEAQQRAQQKALEDEKTRIQANLGKTTKAMDDDVNSSWRKINAMRAQRVPAATPPKGNYQLPQFLKDKPVTEQVPARMRTEAETPQLKNKGLSGQLEQAIQTARQQITDHASRLYGMAAKVSGDTPIDVSGLRQAVADFVDGLPPDVQGSVPRLLMEVKNNENETMTLAQLQQVRSTLRDFGYNPKLTPDLKKGPYQLVAGKADKLMHDPANPPAVKQGVRIIDAGDKFYRTHMAQFQSQTLQKITDDVRDGLPMDARKVLSLVDQPGESGTLKRIVQIGGERARIQLRNADFDRLVADATKPGTQELDAKKLLSALEDRQQKGSLRTLYGDDAAEILSYAKKLAARQGALSSQNLKPGNFRLMLEHANDLTQRLPELQKATEPSKAEAVRAAAAQMAEKRAAEHPNAEVTSTRVVSKNDEADKIREKGAKEGESVRAQGETKTKELATVRQDLQDWTSELKKAALSTEDVASKTSAIVSKLKTRGLLTQEQYDSYLSQIKDVNEKFEASKKLKSDRIQARKHLLYISGGIMAGLGLWENRRAVLDLARGIM